MSRPMTRDPRINRSAEQTLTPSEVAHLFGVDPKTVTRWAKQGKIPSFRTPGGHHRFRRSDVERYLGPADGKESRGDQ